MFASLPLKNIFDIDRSYMVLKVLWRMGDPLARLQLGPFFQYFLVAMCPSEQKSSPTSAMSKDKVAYSMHQP